MERVLEYPRVVERDGIEGGTRTFTHEEYETEGELPSLVSQYLERRTEGSATGEREYPFFHLRGIILCYQNTLY